VGVAGNISEKDAVAAGDGAPGGKNVNPVAVEVPVNATGTRPTESNGKRDLFSEETSTVLVFENGAVIRLSAAVATGQLLFLTNSQTKREVVCQVKKKRSYRPTSCYVELEFTEAVEDFWGVDFSANEATEQSAEAAEMVAESEVAGGEFGESTPVPNQEAVKKLKDEVEELRQQLKALRETANAGTSVDAPEVQVGVPPVGLPSVTAFILPDPALPEKQALPSPEQPPESPRETWQEKPIETPPLELREAETVRPARVEESTAAETPAAKTTRSEKASQKVEDTIGVAIPWRDEEFSKKEQGEEKAHETGRETGKPAIDAAKTTQGSGMRVSMALPNRPGAKSPADATKLLARQQEEMELLESLLPKPELDFSKLPKIVHAEPGEDMSIYRLPRTRAEKRRITAMVTLLVFVAVGGAFYTKLIPAPNVRKWMGKKSAVRVAAAPAVDASVAKNDAAGVVAKGAAATNPEASPAQETETGEAADTAAVPGAAKPVPAAEKASGTSPEARARRAKEAQTELENEARAEALASNSGARGAGKKADKPEAKGAAAEPVPSDAPFVAAKLTRLVNPVYPPDAMLNYITGDVKVDAVVEETGKVGAVKVISGPAPLRQAALDALRQYEYAPATQGGRAVESHVVVTVKFWYNP
jgi:TonB family protein